jgi:hypothetical protein
VIPEGGMVFSDPLTFNVTAGQWLDVSFYLTNTIPSLVQHSWATDAYEYAAPIGAGDHAADTADTGYTASGNINGAFTDLVTGLDVQTAGIPTRSCSEHASRRVRLLGATAHPSRCTASSPRCRALRPAARRVTEPAGLRA